MRDYQVQGLNWMISLHHNGINGILADEMVRNPNETLCASSTDSLGSRKDTANNLIPRIPQIPAGHRRSSSYRRPEIDIEQLG